MTTSTRSMMSIYRHCLSAMRWVSLSPTAPVLSLFSRVTVNVVLAFLVLNTVRCRRRPLEPLPQHYHRRLDQARFVASRQSMPSQYAHPPLRRDGFHLQMRIRILTRAMLDLLILTNRPLDVYAQPRVSTGHPGLSLTVLQLCQLRDTACCIHFGQL